MEQTNAEAVRESILEDRIRTGIRVELGIMVDEGLLEMGVNSDGEAVFWPTEHGARVLGMEP
jgi:hypothetical protein